MKYDTGRYVLSKQKFDVEVAGDGCDRFMAGTIQRIVGTDRWQRLMDRAQAFNATSASGHPEHSKQRRLGHIPDSSPVSSDAE